MSLNFRYKTSITNRERQILETISLDNTYEEIAHLLSISVETVKSHRRNLGHKLDVRTNGGLIRRAFEWGLLESSSNHPNKETDFA